MVFVANLVFATMKIYRYNIMCVSGTHPSRRYTFLLSLFFHRFVPKKENRRPASCRHQRFKAFSGVEYRFPSSLIQSTKNLIFRQSNAGAPSRQPRKHLGNILDTSRRWDDLAVSRLASPLSSAFTEPVAAEPGHYQAAVEAVGTFAGAEIDDPAEFR